MTTTGKRMLCRLSCQLFSSYSSSHATSNYKESPQAATRSISLSLSQCVSDQFIHSTYRYDQSLQGCLVGSFNGIFGVSQPVPLDLCILDRCPAVEKKRHCCTWIDWRWNNTDWTTKNVQGRDAKRGTCGQLFSCINWEKFYAYISCNMSSNVEN